MKSYPVGMKERHIKQYEAWEEEIKFNETHHINQEYTEALKDAKHALIAMYYCKNLEGDK
jgi:hypothetical protein